MDDKKLQRAIDEIAKLKADTEVNKMVLGQFLGFALAGRL